MQTLSDTHAIFRQLAALDGPHGVKTIIENQDACHHAQALESSLSTALRLRLAHVSRDPHRAARIAFQRDSLRHLVTLLRPRLASAS